MKDLNEILSHVQAIDAFDQRNGAESWQRKRNLEVLACTVADELIAGRPVPVFNDASGVIRIGGFIPELANELVRQHDMAIAHRTHLSERLEADGGENGAKAAAILRGMNEAADPSKEDDLPTSSDLWPPRPSFQIHFIKTHGEGGGGCGVPVAGSGAGGGGGSCQGIIDRTARYHAHEAARRERSLAKDAEQKIRAAELRGFYQARDRAFHLILENQGRHPDTIKVSKAFLADLQRDIVHMNKEG